MKLAWLTSWDRVCGIADYSKLLWEEVRGPGDSLISLDEFPSEGALLARLSNETPDLLHVQHEFAFFGGKNPPFYWFPRFVARVRKRFPAMRIVATSERPSA